jgi:nicotinamide mononucleotide transporter
MDFLYPFNVTIAYFLQNPYEFWGFITSVICVWLNVKENIWGWVFAIVAAGFYCKVFYDINLMGDLILQIIFIILSIYGIYAWLYGGTQSQSLSVSKLPHRLIFPLLLIFGVAMYAVAQLLKWLNGDIVYIDASTTTISLIAQWMMARKYIENWLVWIFVDLLYVGVYLYKGVYLTSFLYFIFLFLATLGYLKWKKTLSVNL